ncbi:tyrosine-type recombinase/integrase [Bacillus mycoides]|uniref:tyrosine-type recombinase/integrase n=1 Tax=Bacillus cereus group TaxID=86661 RepID=UPI003D1E658D
MKKVKQAILDEQQIETIQHILSQSSKRDNLLFLFTLHSCLKVSEILQLQVRDVLDTNGKLRNSILFYNEKEKIHKWFAVNEILHYAIKHYIKKRNVQTPDEPLLKSQKGRRPISRQHAWHVLNKTAKAVGIDSISSHTLQKTWGYYAYKSGIDIALLQHFFGHSSPATTLKYIDITRKNS